MFIVGYIWEVFCIFLLATSLLGMVRGAFSKFSVVCCFGDGLFALIFVEWLGQEEFLPF